MRLSGIRPDSITVLLLIDAILRVRSLTFLGAVHSFGIRIGIRDDLTVANTLYVKAVNCYKVMLDGAFSPDISTILNLLLSCMQPMALFHGLLVHSHGVKLGCDSDVASHSKKGLLGYAEEIVEGWE
ncbi:uncharacterized protein HKW66_Vig0012100 [Vigna angularis]|uniref:Uncharacterized protein n=1 Tax=Phaseolus angularis TaxID=3914 RepID=A0A8T0LJ13_PHAAN|nr:uncharacterized protein HKW66_Vig0012100 [Vigna angularis]